MTSTQITALRRPLARLAGAVAPFVCLAMALAAPAAAAPVAFGSGSLDWGVRDTFRSYVIGPIAHGSYTASNGATKIGPEPARIRFDVLGGSYDADTGAGELTIDGTVRFEGHGGQLDMTVRNLCVAFAGGSGTLYADISSKEMPKVLGEEGEMRHYTGLALVNMPSVPAPTPSGDDLVWPSIATTMNKAAVPVFANYSPGEAFDPVEPLTATLGTPRPRPAGGPCRSVSAGGGSGGGASGGSTAMPTVRGASKAVMFGAGRIARIATLRCGTAPCKVTTPKSVKVKIKRKRYRVEVLAPKSLKPGGTGKLRVKLPRAARKALAGRRTAVEVKVTLVADGRKTTTTIKATLKAKAARAAAGRS